MRDGDITRGRREFAAIIAAGAVAFLLVGAGAWLRGGHVNWVGALGRPIVLVGLGGLAWEGRGWARTAATVWMGLIAVVVLLSAVPLVGVSVPAAAIFFALGFGFFVAAFRLQTSPHIDAALLARQRARTAAVRPPAA